jgi:hypothetical protein
MRWAMMVGVAAMVFGTVARADDDKNTVVRGEDTTVFKKKTTIDFSDVTLEGELTKPEGQYGLARGKTKFNSLIKLRANFTPELQKSVDQL